MILGMIYNPKESAYVPPVIPDIENSTELWHLFAVEFPTYMKEIALSLLPIVLFFLAFQLLVLKLSKRTLMKIFVGLIYYIYRIWFCF